MPRTFTSLHRINGDTSSLTAVKRYGFVYLNRLNNAFSDYWIDSALRRSFFISPQLEVFWSDIGQTVSPSRALCDLFWRELPWPAIQDELEGIYIFDIGCGSGHYGLILSKASGGRIAHYVGMDVVEHPGWADLSLEYPKFFCCRKSGSDRRLGPFPQNTNLIISQSAFEHISDDLRYFRDLRDFILRERRCGLQVHMLPAAACLQLYPYHGIRQYTPRTVSMISRLFREFSVVRLFALGGQACNALHWKWITRPQEYEHRDLRYEWPEEYNRLLQAAIREDFATHGSEPAFYALTIQSFPHKDLLSGWCGAT
ncbi:conserved hypothetical protein [Desulfovibrionales bacterium]